MADKLPTLDELNAGLLPTREQLPTLEQLNAKLIQPGVTTPAEIAARFPPGTPGTPPELYRTRPSVLLSAFGKGLGAANEAARQVFETSQRLTEGEPVSAAPTFWAAMGATPAVALRTGRAAEALVPRAAAKVA